jgi:alkylglycerol monooxygenase
MEGRALARWAEGVRVLATAVVPLLGGRWFGISHLDVQIALAITAVFGLSAVALPWLGRSSTVSHAPAAS